MYDFDDMTLFPRRKIDFGAPSPDDFRRNMVRINWETSVSTDYRHMIKPMSTLELMRDTLDLLRDINKHIQRTGPKSLYWHNRRRIMRKRK